MGIARKEIIKQRQPSPKVVPKAIMRCQRPNPQKSSGCATGFTHSEKRVLRLGAAGVSSGWYRGPDWKDLKEALKDRSASLIFWKMENQELLSSQVCLLLFLSCRWTNVSQTHSSERVLEVPWVLDCPFYYSNAISGQWQAAQALDWECRMLNVPGTVIVLTMIRDMQSLRHKLNALWVIQFRHHYVCESCVLCTSWKCAPIPDAWIQK